MYRSAFTKRSNAVVLVILRLVKANSTWFQEQSEVPGAAGSATFAGKFSLI